VALPPPASRVRTRNSTWKTREDENAEPESPTLEKSPTEQLQEQTFIGPSVSIKGELSSKEDLIIQGRVEGEIDLKKNNVVRESAMVLGDIETPRFSIGEGAKFKGHIDVIPGTKEDSQPQKRVDGLSPGIIETMDSPDKEPQGLELVDKSPSKEEEDS
jgi:hypothetical protein